MAQIYRHSPITNIMQSRQSLYRQPRMSSPRKSSPRCKSLLYRRTTTIEPRLRTSPLSPLTRMQNFLRKPSKFLKRTLMEMESKSHYVNRKQKIAGKWPYVDFEKSVRRGMSAHNVLVLDCKSILMMLLVWFVFHVSIFVVFVFFLLIPHLWQRRGVLNVKLVLS